MANPARKKLNWSEYNKGQVNQGKIHLWLTPEALAEWRSPKSSGRRGRPQEYGDRAIETLLTLREIFHLTYRRVAGFAVSLFEALQLSDKRVPDYTLICKRAKTLSIHVRTFLKNEPLYLLVDSTGLKVYGEGEWKVRTHDKSKRREWKKVHIMIDSDSFQVCGVDVTSEKVDDATGCVRLIDQVRKRYRNPIRKLCGDGGYDKAKVYRKAGEHNIIPVIPPRKNARLDHIGKFGKFSYRRNNAVRHLHGDRLKEWKIKVGYHKRSRVETEMYRIKKIFGSELKSRLTETQRVETITKINILNKMTSMIT